MKTTRIFISSPGDVAEERDKPEGRRIGAAAASGYEHLLELVLPEDMVC